MNQKLILDEINSTLYLEINQVFSIAYRDPCQPFLTLLNNYSTTNAGFNILHGFSGIHKCKENVENL